MCLDEVEESLQVLTADLSIDDAEASEARDTLEGLKEWDHGTGGEGVSSDVELL